MPESKRNRRARKHLQDVDDDKEYSDLMKLAGALLDDEPGRFFRGLIESMRRRPSTRNKLPKVTLEQDLQLSFLATGPDSLFDPPKVTVLPAGSELTLVGRLPLEVRIFLRGAPDRTIVMKYHTDKCWRVSSDTGLTRARAAGYRRMGRGPERSF